MRGKCLCLPVVTFVMFYGPKSKPLFVRKTIDRWTDIDGRMDGHCTLGWFALVYIYIYTPCVYRSKTYVESFSDLLFFMFCWRTIKIWLHRVWVLSISGEEYFSNSRLDRRKKIFLGIFLNLNLNFWWNFRSEKSFVFLWNKFFPLLHFLAWMTTVKKFPLASSVFSPLSCYFRFPLGGNMEKGGKWGREKRRKDAWQKSRFKWYQPFSFLFLHWTLKYRGFFSYQDLLYFSANLLTSNFHHKMVFCTIGKMYMFDKKVCTLLARMNWSAAAQFSSS